jgi:hypothetical protein
VTTTAEVDERLRLEIYHGFATTGRVPSQPELADRAGVTRREVTESLDRLAAARHVVLDATGACWCRPAAPGVACRWPGSSGGTPSPGNEVAHFLVPMARVWDDVVTTCGSQRLFCSTGCVHRWLERTANSLGSVLDLGRLVAACTALVRRPARAWLRPPRAQPGRRPLPRRGLRGPFWGLG